MKSKPIVIEAEKPLQSYQKIIKNQKIVVLASNLEEAELKFREIIKNLTQK